MNTVEIRFAVTAPHPHELRDVALRTAWKELADGWEVESLEQSYPAERVADRFSTAGYWEADFRAVLAEEGS